MTVEEKARVYAKKLVVLENKGKFSDEANLRAAEYYAYKSHLAGYTEAMRWRDPKEELPKINSRVLLKSETGYVETRTIRNWHISGNNLSLILGGKKVIGWRPIE